jgi:hypothetical protein
MNEGGGTDDSRCDCVCVCVCVCVCRGAISNPTRFPIDL